MSRAPKFTIRGLLLFITFLAVACFALIKPSMWWAAAWPAIWCLVSIYAVFHFVPWSDSHRAYWTSFLIGVITYTAGVLFVRSFYLSGCGFDPWQRHFGPAFWALLHEEGAAGAGKEGYTCKELMSFIITLHGIVATVLSAAAALVLQFLVGARDRQSSR